jgi:tetratricopeptide (TPR) repeat protein
MGNYPNARTVFDEVLERVRDGQIGYNDRVAREAEYYLGLCDMSSKQFGSAVGHFTQCDRLSREIDGEEPSGFLILSNLNLGKAYDAESRRDLAVIQYRKVLEMDEYKDSHDQAERFLETPFSQ